jgi:hypothetical protein
MVERNAGMAADRRIEFRIGIHLGDVVEEPDGDLMGDNVNIAARIDMALRPPAKASVYASHVRNTIESRDLSWNHATSATGAISRGDECFAVCGSDFAFGHPGFKIGQATRNIRPKLPRRRTNTAANRRERQ